MTARTRKPAEKREWHLVCVTRKGKVSMLQNLTLEMARETYKKLLPGTYPVNYYHPKCWGGKLAEGGRTEDCKSDTWSHTGVTYGGDGRDREPDRLEKVEVLGPKGQTLNPWAGAKPREIRMHCRCEPKKAAAVPQPFMRPKRAEPWRRARTDFWNHPRLWDRVKDPFKQMCWEMVR